MIDRAGYLRWYILLIVSVQLLCTPRGILAAEDDKGSNTPCKEEDKDKANVCDKEKTKQICTSVENDDNEDDDGNDDKNEIWLCQCPEISLDKKDKYEANVRYFNKTTQKICALKEGSLCPTKKMKEDEIKKIFLNLNCQEKFVCREVSNFTKEEDKKIGLGFCTKSDGVRLQISIGLMAILLFLYLTYNF